MNLHRVSFLLIFCSLFTTSFPANAFSQEPGKEKSASEVENNSKQKNKTWKVGEVEREALVYAPGKSDEKRPLVFVFHGHGGTSKYSARKFAIQDLWPEAVCVCPQGLPTPSIIDPEGKKSGWQKSIGDQKDRDLEFFDAMLKTMIDDYNVDPKRVYVTGHSNGGYFTYVLCAARGDKIAAIAPVAAADTLKDFKDQKPKPLFHVAGEKDPLVKFSIQEKTIEHMRKLNGCDAEGKEAGKYCKKYASDKGTPVVTYIHPGGHEVPDGAPQRIVEFFKEYKLK